MLRRRRDGELPQHQVAGGMTVAVVDHLEMIDVEHEHRKRFAALRGILEQRLEVARHVPPIVQVGQRIEDRHLDRLLETRTKIVGVALPLDLSAHPGEQLVRIDRPHDIVIHPHVEAPEQTGIVARLNHDQDRQVPRPVERAHLRAQPQTVGMVEVEADDHQVEISVRQAQEGAGRIGLPRHGISRV